MTQQDIINIASQYHGKPMSKQEVYSMYPTEEHFMYAMGGRINAYKAGGRINMYADGGHNCPAGHIWSESMQLCIKQNATTNVPKGWTEARKEKDGSIIYEKDTPAKPSKPAKAGLSSIEDIITTTGGQTVPSTGNINFNPNSNTNPKQSTTTTTKITKTPGTTTKKVVNPKSNVVPSKSNTTTKKVVKPKVVVQGTPGIVNPDGTVNTISTPGNFDWNPSGVTMERPMSAYPGYVEPDADNDSKVKPGTDYEPKKEYLIAKPIQPEYSGKPINSWQRNNNKGNYSKPRKQSGKQPPCPNMGGRRSGRNMTGECVPMQEDVPFNNTFTAADGGLVDIYRLMGMPTPAMYGAGGPYIDDSMEGYNDGLANASPVFNPNPPQNNTPLKFVERKPANTVNYNLDYNNNLNSLTPEQALRLNAAYNHNFKSGINVGAQGNYNINRIMPQESGSPIIKQNWDAAVNAGYTGRNSNISIGANYNPQEGVKGNIKGSWNFGAKHANGGNIFPTMYGFGSMVDGMDGEDPVAKGTFDQPRIVQEVPQGYNLVPGSRNTYMISTPGSSSSTPTLGNTQSTHPRITNQVNRVNRGNTSNVVNRGNVVRQNPSVVRQSTPGMEDYVTLNENMEPMVPRPIQPLPPVEDWQIPRLKRQPVRQPNPPDTDGGGWFFGGGRDGEHSQSINKHGSGNNKRPPNHKSNNNGGGCRGPKCRGPVGSRWEDGGPIDYSPSYEFGHVQSDNTTYNHGYANGGDVYSQANNYNNWLIDPNYMNGQIPMHGGGGFLRRAGNDILNSALLGVDNLASVVNTDIIGDKRYLGQDASKFADASHYMGETINSLAPTAANIFIPGSGAFISAGQALADKAIKDDELRLQSNSGQIASKIGLGLDIGAAVTGAAAPNLFGAADAGAKIATTAPKTINTINNVGKGLKYASLASDAYDTAKDPNADWKDYASLGLNTAGTIGGDLGKAGKTGLNQSIKSLQPSIGANPYGSTQALENMRKFANVGAMGSQLSNASRAGRAGMSLYNTGENIDQNGLDLNTGVQAFNAVGQGLGAASGYMDNPGFSNFSDKYNAIGSGLNFGKNLYNTVDSGTKDAASYMQLIPGGLDAGLQIEDQFSQRPGQYTPSSLGQHAMGGAVNAPNMMQYALGGYPMLPPNVSTGRGIVNKYAAGGSTGYNTYDLAELSKSNNLMDNSRLLGYNLVGTDKFAEGGDSQVTMGNVEKGELLLDENGRIVTEYRGGGMVPHPEDGSQDSNGNVPLQEGQFIIPKRFAKPYKIAKSNNDELYAASLKNTTERVKAEKEAKEKAEQEAMQQKAMNAYGRFVAKYGGHVPGLNMYGKGAKVDPNFNKNLMQKDRESWNDYEQRILTQDPKELKNLQDIYTPEEMDKWGITLPGMTNSDYIDYVNNQTSTARYNRHIENAKKALTTQQQTDIDNIGNEVPVKSTPVNFQNPYAGYKEAHEMARNKRIDKAIMLGQAAPIAYNVLSSLFGKEAKMTTEDVAPLQYTNLSGEAARRALKSAYATSKYNTPVGSGYLAERTKRAADYMEATSKLEQDLGNMNAQGRMGVAERNTAIDAANKDRRAQAKMFEMQTKAARQGAMSTGLTQLGQVANNYRQEEAYKRGVYPSMSNAFKFINGQWVFQDPTTV